MPKFSGRGGEVRWQKGVKGTNLVSTPEQRETWFLWERLRGSSTIIGKVISIGREFQAFDFNGKDRGVFRSVSPAKKAVELAAKVSEKR